MIINLNEINRVLLSIKDLASDNTPVRHSLLVRYLEGEVVLGRNPDFDLVLETLERLGLIRRSRGRIQATEFGTEVILENTEHVYELRAAQRRLLIRKCYLDGALRREMKRLAKKFSVDQRSGRISWSPMDSEPIEDLEWLIEHLTQLGVLEQSKELLIVRGSYKAAILQFMDESADFTEKQLEDHLRDKRLSGEIAEAFAVQFEIGRLAAAGHTVEAACVNRISKRRVNAGFDITSFDGKSRRLAYDRFIEVKGSGKPTVSFIWTPNEMRRAQELRGRYWIYFIGGVDRNNSAVTREPILIQDPHVTLATDGRYRSSQYNTIVEADFAGPRLNTPVKVRIY
jgi:hypothetical protein